MKVSRTSRLNGEYQKEISEIIRLKKDRMDGVSGLISVTEMSPFKSGALSFKRRIISLTSF